MNGSVNSMSAGPFLYFLRIRVPWSEAMLYRIQWLWIRRSLNPETWFWQKGWKWGRQCSTQNMSLILWGQTTAFSIMKGVQCNHTTRWLAGCPGNGVRSEAQGWPLLWADGTLICDGSQRRGSPYCWPYAWLYPCGQGHFVLRLIEKASQWLEKGIKWHSWVILSTHLLRTSCAVYILRLFWNISSLTSPPSCHDTSFPMLFSPTLSIYYYSEVRWDPNHLFFHINQTTRCTVQNSAQWENPPFITVFEGHPRIKMYYRCQHIPSVNQAHTPLSSGHRNLPEAMCMK